MILYPNYAVGDDQAAEPFGKRQREVHGSNRSSRCSDQVDAFKTQMI